MDKEQMINELYDQIKGWQREIDSLEDMKESAYQRIDQLNGEGQEDLAV